MSNSYSRRLKTQINRHRPSNYKKDVLAILWSFVRFLFLLGLAFVVLRPLISATSIAFRQSQDIKDPSIIWIPKHFTLANFKTAMENMGFGNAMFNTLRIGVVSSFLQVASCAIAGYGFARFQFKAKRILFVCMLMTLIIPPQTLFIPTYILYFKLGLIDNVFSMYLPALFGVGIRSGLFIYIYRQFYMNLPRELEDAALVDGCGYYMTFVRIILPSVRTAIITVFLFSVVWYYNDVYFTDMYFDTTVTISRALAGLQSSLSIDFRGDTIMKSAILQSGSLLSIVPVLSIYIVFHRFFVEGIERSGIVG